MLVQVPEEAIPKSTISCKLKYIRCSAASEDCLWEAFILKAWNKAFVKREGGFSDNF